MCTLAIWDGRERRLVMIRDRMGVKPLYFYRTHDGVLFGSAALLQVARNDIERALDPATWLDIYTGMMFYTLRPSADDQQ